MRPVIKKPHEKIGIPFEKLGIECAKMVTSDVYAQFECYDIIKSLSITTITVNGKFDNIKLDERINKVEDMDNFKRAIVDDPYIIKFTSDHVKIENENIDVMLDALQIKNNTVRKAETNQGRQPKKASSKSIINSAEEIEKHIATLVNRISIDDANHKRFKALSMSEIDYDLIEQKQQQQQSNGDGNGNGCSSSSSPSPSSSSAAIATAVSKKFSKHFQSQITASIISIDHRDIKLYNIKIFRTGSFCLPGVVDIRDAMNSLLYVRNKLNEAFKAADDNNASEISLVVNMINFKGNITLPPDTQINISKLVNLINATNQNKIIYDTVSNSNCIGLNFKRKCQFDPYVIKTIIDKNEKLKNILVVNSDGVEIEVVNDNAFDNLISTKDKSYLVEIYPSGKIGVKGIYNIKEMFQTIIQIDKLVNDNLDKVVDDILPVTEMIYKKRGRKSNEEKEILRKTTIDFEKLYNNLPVLSEFNGKTFNESKGKIVNTLMKLMLSNNNNNNNNNNLPVLNDELDEETKLQLSLLSDIDI